MTFRLGRARPVLLEHRRQRLACGARLLLGPGGPLVARHPVCAARCPRAARAVSARRAPGCGRHRCARAASAWASASTAAPRARVTVDVLRYARGRATAQPALVARFRSRARSRSPGAGGPTAADAASPTACTPCACAPAGSTAGGHPRAHAPPQPRPLRRRRAVRAQALVWPGGRRAAGLARVRRPPSRPAPRRLSPEPQPPAWRYGDPPRSRGRRFKTRARAAGSSTARVSARGRRRGEYRVRIVARAGPRAGPGHTRRPSAVVWPRGQSR